MEARAAELVRDLRTMIAAGYLAGDREMTAEKRHAAALLRAVVNDALERAAVLVEKTPSPAAAAVLAAAVRDLKIQESALGSPLSGESKDAGKP
ncbi:MAG TPA: hypothetical protein VMS17_02205 [Gemmataceae bacterium]|nr:hypothetical protein [Gemmataceae bacterium]